MLTEHGRLIIQLDDQIIQILELSMPLIKIGRLPDNQISLPANTVSRVHAEIRMSSQGPLLTDLGGVSGTFIGTYRLPANQPFLLKNGSMVRIGSYQLTYQTSGTIAPVQVSEMPSPEKPVQSAEARAEQTVQPTSARSMVNLASKAETKLELEPLPRRPAPGQVIARQSRLFRPGSPEAECTFLRSLPDIFQENDFLRRFLLIFEAIWEPLEGRQDHIEMYFDPRTCPTTFLPWLASWLDLPYDSRWSESRIRRLLSQGTELYQWRGTKHGLIRMIEVCTSLIPTITDVPGQPHVFRIQIALTAPVAGETVDRALIEDLIQSHKPAHAGYILEVIE